MHQSREPDSKGTSRLEEDALAKRTTIPLDAERTKEEGQRSAPSFVQLNADLLERTGRTRSRCVPEASRSSS